MKRNLKKAIIVAAIIFAALQLLSASSSEEEYRTYFVLENETVTPEWVRRLLLPWREKLCVSNRKQH